MTSAVSSLTAYIPLPEAFISTTSSILSHRVTQLALLALAGVGLIYFIMQSQIWEANPQDPSSINSIPITPDEPPKKKEKEKFLAVVQPGLTPNSPICLDFINKLSTSAESSTKKCVSWNDDSSTLDLLKASKITKIFYVFYCSARMDDAIEKDLASKVHKAANKSNIDFHLVCLYGGEIPPAGPSYTYPLNKKSVPVNHYIKCNLRDNKIIDGMDKLHQLFSRPSTI